MMAAGVVWDVWLLLIGLFVMLGAGAEEREESARKDEHPGGEERPLRAWAGPGNQSAP